MIEGMQVLKLKCTGQPRWGSLFRANRASAPVPGHNTHKNKSTFVRCAIVCKQHSPSTARHHLSASLPRCPTAPRTNRGEGAVHSVDMQGRHGLWQRWLVGLHGSGGWIVGCCVLLAAASSTSAGGPAGDRRARQPPSRSLPADSKEWMLGSLYVRQCALYVLSEWARMLYSSASASERAGPGVQCLPDPPSSLFPFSE
jgi:hypothetical protein